MRNHLWAAVSQGRLLIGAQSVDDVSNYRWFTLRTWSSAVSLPPCLSLILSCPSPPSSSSLSSSLPPFLSLSVYLFLILVPFSPESFSFQEWHWLPFPRSIFIYFILRTVQPLVFFFFSFSSELTRSKQSWNKAELAAELLSHIPTSIGTHFFLPAHTRITFYQHSINLSPRWENGHAIVLQPAIVFGLNASQPACAFFFSPFGVIFFIVVQPHEETPERCDGASAVYGRGKQGLAAPRNKWLDYLKPLPRSNSNT